MMRVFCTIIFLIFTNLIQGQKLIDVITDHNIDIYQEFTLSNTTGLSFFDFDEDGWDDLTYPMHNDSILFYKNVNGVLTPIGSYIYANGTVRQMLWVDYDNNGSLDLFISYDEDELRLYKNDGNFNFTDVSVSSGLFPTVANPMVLASQILTMTTTWIYTFVATIPIHHKINITKIKETEPL